MKKSMLMASIFAIGVAFFATDSLAATTRATCSAGQYLKGKSCQTCEAGHYCPDGKNRKTCPAGSFCPAGSSSPQACTGNYYSAAGQSNCTTKKCDGANQIVNSSHTGCTSCGTKQEPNEQHTACQNRCVAGQYVKVSGRNRICEPCEAGHYCPDGKNRKTCPAGSFCPAGSSSPQACTGNYYSAAGQSNCTTKKCDGANQIVNSSHTACAICGLRQEPNEEHTACQNRCVAGQYVKISGRNKTCESCEAGWYCPDGKNRRKCSNGSIPNATKTGCTVCQNGTYEKGGQSCEPCPAGLYCQNGIRRNCPSKHYCPANSANAIACPANATCADGKTFKCKKGFRQQGNSCVK